REQILRTPGQGGRGAVEQAYESGDATLVARAKKARADEEAHARVGIVEQGGEWPMVSGSRAGQDVSGRDTVRRLRGFRGGDDRSAGDGVLSLRLKAEGQERIEELLADFLPVGEGQEGEQYLDGAFGTTHRQQPGRGNVPGGMGDQLDLGDT